MQKRGAELFIAEKKEGGKFFDRGKILKTRPGYPVNFDWSLISLVHFVQFVQTSSLFRIFLRSPKYFSDPQFLNIFLPFHRDVRKKIIPRFSDFFSDDNNFQTPSFFDFFRGRSFLIPVWGRKFFEKTPVFILPLIQISHILFHPPYRTFTLHTSYFTTHTTFSPPIIPRS